MMIDAIRVFATQFAYEPVIENAKVFVQKKRFLVVGMGGSHLAADLMLIFKPEAPLYIYSDYGLPKLSETELNDHLIILSSYSGNTEEVLAACDEVVQRRLSAIVLAVGGELLNRAKEFNLPYIELPSTGIQPRSALGFSLRALAKAMDQDEVLHLSSSLARDLDPNAFEEAGKKLSEELRNYVPVIYTSRVNQSVAYNWKIKLNETGKIPAFYNILPELNHNEMNGFDVNERSKQLSDKFYFLLIKDQTDHPRVQRGMEILARLYQERGRKVKILELKGPTPYHKIFSSLILADWTAVYLAAYYGLESEQVPMVEEFKKLIST